MPDCLFDAEWPVGVVLWIRGCDRNLDKEPCGREAPVESFELLQKAGTPVLEYSWHP